MSTPMQGKRIKSSSLAGAFDIDNVSSSSNTSVDQPFYWNDMRNPVENQVVNFCPPTSNNIHFLNSIRQERQYLPGSSNIHPEVDDNAQKTEHLPTASANSFTVSGIVPQDQVYGPANFVSLSIQGPSSSSFAPNLNSPVGFMGRGSEDSPLIECPNLYMPSRSDALMVASSSRDVVQDNEAGPGVPFNGRRLPCKRKALEGHVGTSSEAGGSYLRNVECGTLPDVHAAYNVGMNSAFSPPLNQRDLGHELSLAGVAASNVPYQTVSNYSQRNCRFRINSVDQGAPNPPALDSSAGSIVQSTGPSSQQQSAVPMVDPSLDARSLLSGGHGSIHGHHAVLHIPAIPQSGHSVRWSRGIISRRGGSPNAAFSQTRDIASNDEASSSRGRGSAREIPLFLSNSEMGIFVPNPSSGRVPAADPTLPSNGFSSSRSGPSSSAHRPSNTRWDSHHNCSSHYPHRWSENVCRSLMSSMNSEHERQTNHSTLNPGYPTASSQEMVLPSRPSYQGHAFPSRSSILSLSAAAEGRRLASEVRNVLDLVRRGEGLRFEDFMLLEQSVFYGMVDIHDRHRDMRLDVDNMSYEELLALEERIGNVSTGLSEENILARLKQRQHTAATGSNDEIEPCCVCQEEYIAGDDLGALECGHDFHRDCIKQWLMQKNSCPICKTTGLTT